MDIKRTQLEEEEVVIKLRTGNVYKIYMPSCENIEKDKLFIRNVSVDSKIYDLSTRQGQP